MRSSIEETIKNIEVARDIPLKYLFPESDGEIKEYRLPADTTTSVVQPLGPYKTSEYLEDFLGKYDGDIVQNQKLKEAVIMKKSALQKLLEEIEIKADGKDDGELGAVQPENNDSIEKSLDELLDKAEELDKKLDIPAEEDKLLGDVDKETVVNEEVYTEFVNNLVHNLCEISINCQLDGKKPANENVYKVMVESFYRTVVNKEKPVLWESLSEEGKNTIAAKVSCFMEYRDLLLSKPTLGNLIVVENFINITDEILKEGSWKDALDQIGSRSKAAINVAKNSTPGRTPNASDQLNWTGAKRELRNQGLRKAAAERTAAQTGTLKTKLTNIATDKNTIAGAGAVAGLGILWVLYRLYKNRMTAKCDSLKGAEKAKCRAALFNQAAKAAKSKMETACKNAKDAGKCKAKFTSTIAKWEAAANAEEAKAKA